MLGAEMLKAGLVSSEDVERAEREKAEKDAEKAAIEALVARLDRAMRKIPTHLANEMVAWMEGNRLLPIGVLEEWGTLKEGDIKIEWSRWLCAAREVNV